MTPTGDSHPPATRSIQVVDQRGAPIAEAVLAIQPPSLVPAIWIGQSDAGGVIPLPSNIPKDHGITVTAKGLKALYLPPETIEALPQSLTLTEPDSEASLATVRAVDSENRPLPQTLVRIVPFSSNAADLFYFVTDTDGVASGHLPTSSLIADVADKGYLSEWAPLRIGHERDVTVVAQKRTLVESSASEDVISSLREVVSVTNTATPEIAAKLLERGEVFGLGEATHGTGDFFQWKSSLIKLLVQRGETNVIAFEANGPEARNVDRFVRYGEGDVREALASMYFWIWDTEEVIELLEWLRDHNKGLPEAKRVRFVGVDSQFTAEAAQKIIAGIVGESLENQVRESLEPLAGEKSSSTLFRLTADQRVELNKRLDEVELRLGKLNKLGTIATDIRTVRQAIYITEGDRLTRTDRRDEVMAKNILALVEEPETQKIVFWSHNLHVARTQARYAKPTGQWLAERLKEKYVAIGFAFDNGEFRARDSNRRGNGVEVIRVPKAKPHFVEASLRMLGTAFFLDLSSLSSTSAGAAWLRVPRRMRIAGSSFQRQPTP